jgi:hypothetical protein
MGRSDEFSLGNSPLISEIRKGTDSYARQQGFFVPAAYHRAVGAIMSPTSQHQIAVAHENMTAWDDNARPAYEAMREESSRQYDHMTKPRSKGGMGIDVEVSKEDPYGGQGARPHDIFREMHDDVASTGRIKVLSTEATGGHPFFTNEENDRIRAVHDVFGHLGSSRGVDRHGEEAAYQRHAAMFSPTARQAVGTEFRGQTSYLIKNHEFPPQRMGLLPEHLQAPQFAAVGAGQAQVEQARKFSREQHL